MPGNDPPTTFRPLESEAVSAARWKSGGNCSDRCGSFATIAKPVADFAPLTTQLFEPAPSRREPKVWFISRICAWTCERLSAHRERSGAAIAAAPPPGSLDG